MNIQSRHHTWLIVALLIVALSACTTQPVSSTPSPTPPNQPVPSSTPPNQPTPSSTTPNQPTPKPAGPSQTLATFCNAMKASNNDLATAQFTSRGLQEFQPSTSPPRKAYSSCNYDHVTIFTNSTAGAHLVVETVGNNRTYQITVTLILDGNRWKIDSWISK